MFTVFPHRGKSSLQWLALEPDFQPPSGRKPRGKFQRVSSSFPLPTPKNALNEVACRMQRFHDVVVRSKRFLFV
jgi:hypothetical protein